MTEYVVGFMINDKNQVLLIIKNRPEWQKGLMNGIGGHIEANELPETAMKREFLEETGCSTDHFSWKNFATLSGPDWKVYFFVLRVKTFPAFQTVTDEVVVAVNIETLNFSNCIPNIIWLISMAKSIEYYRCKRTDHFEIREA